MIIPSILSRGVGASSSFSRNLAVGASTTTTISNGFWRWWWGMGGGSRMWMSNLPEDAVYGGPKEQTLSSGRTTLNHLRQKYYRGQPITMVTAYDYPSAVHVDNAGIDICLVGDSASMVVHGHDTTLPITLDEMLVHCRAVFRGAQRPLLVGDLPFGSYETDNTKAVDSAVRLLKEGGMDAIKLEGGAPSRITAARAIVDTGIAVMGHVGLTPQAISVLGGFRPQGGGDGSRPARGWMLLSCFGMRTRSSGGCHNRCPSIPTIGIGAGPFCSGQVLVYHDLLGMMQHPHHAKVTPKFCKQFGHVGEAINRALLEYKEEVENKTFPSVVHSPYKISSNDMDEFLIELEKRGLSAASSAAAAAVDDLK
ncbi:hypothetical protein QJS10_CPA09g00617 [Acorus calamus]|uniref:3-methyl-2-oxobutanoate hydroxymethyltransferase n=1 Tax=Acorus calamus TaxID=4465 RepID=A0AAV9E837_ACOCL|nr:hypothetical protein QJS10_CPA09g00617 [Acorus calamus]